MKTSNEIRNEFIEFFKKRKHTVVPSAPVVPSDDPTLLFTNAGMNQFKDIFLEQGSRPYTRAVDTQKCIRVSGKHNDLEEVGHSPNHHTFFEMLGNWSFGDYYKRDAIKWAWELLTDVWKIDANRLYATVYAGDADVLPDEEAAQMWLDDTSIQKDHVSYHGRKDNFWEMGEIGPCGPCSELHYDMGASFCTDQNNPNHTCEVNGECGRIVEIWNLVFIQYRRDKNGKLHPLPRRHIDTGAGFERIVMVLEGVNSNYETSLFTPIIDRIVALSGVPYHADERGVPHRVAADHVRTLSISLADGVLPSNEGRGYVMRRILRRAARFGREIGLETPFLHKLVEPFVNTMGDVFPELKKQQEHIVGVIRAEEQSFSRTLGRGLEIFGDILKRMNKEKKSVVSGDDAFKMYDTYGFPLDLTQLMARERDLTVDTVQFDVLMAEQKERARGEDKFATFDSSRYIGKKSKFIGYGTEHYIDLNPQADPRIESVYQYDDYLELALDVTPFYTESGGQVSDQGYIEIDHDQYKVIEMKKYGDAIIHKVEWDSSKLPKVGTKVGVQIDKDNRNAIQCNHTATHLLHTALRMQYGQNTNQAGSLVAPDRLRFDFNHFEKPTDEQLETIERTVNQAIRDNHQVRYIKDVPYQQAIDSGITALFGEKYGDVVRVVHIGSDDTPYSRELCGGTHVKATGELGLFRIISESSVSAGVRRIEAVTGEVALDLTLYERNSLERIKDLLGSRGSDPVDKLEKTLSEKRAVEKDLEGMVIIWAGGIASELIASAEVVDGVHIMAHNFTDVEMDRLKLIGDAIRKKCKRGVALVASPSANGSGNLCCVVTDDLIKNSKLKAGALIGQAAKIAGGGGGGRPHLATAGTKHPDKLTDAINQFKDIVLKTLG